MAIITDWQYEIPEWATVVEADEDWEIRRDNIVKLLRESDWFNDDTIDEYEHEQLEEAIDDLSMTPTALAADQDAMWRIYNLADEQRCWLNPFENN